MGNIQPVSAEDDIELLPANPEILYLSGTPLLSHESRVDQPYKFLSISDNGGYATKIDAPFETELIFPVFTKFASNNQRNVYSSSYILNNLSLEFEYTEWDFTEAPGLKLPENPNYTLHVGGTTGAPTKARWGIRKTGKGAYDEYAIEHVFDYLNTDNEWVRVYTRRMRWYWPDSFREHWGPTSETDYYGDIYWEEKQYSKIEHVSPFIEGIRPNPDRNDKQNNIGIIDAILVNRTGQVGKPHDFSSDLKVIGALTRQDLDLSNESPTPSGHYKIKHELAGIRHLLKNDEYIAVGTGEVKSTVTDYEDDVTIFWQDVIVSTSGAPEVDVYFAETDIAYNDEWMSNNESADTLQRQGLDLQAKSTIYGNYDLITNVNGSEVGFTNVTNKYPSDDTVLGNRIIDWKNNNNDSSKEGELVTSIAYLTGEQPNNRTTPLSVESEAKKIFYDSTLPTISGIFFADEEWKELDSDKPHDAEDLLSGLEEATGGVYYRFVKTSKSEVIKAPVDSDWESLSEYHRITKAGEYNLYVYAKDNATNRSSVVKVNDTPIIIPEDSSTSVRLEKKIELKKGNAQDIFIMHLKDENTLLGSVALKKNGHSEWMNLDMAGATYKMLEVWEVVPMDYEDDYNIYTTDAEGNVTHLDKGENQIRVEEGDEMTITIENKFNHAGYFRAKDTVKNMFARLT